MSNLNKYDKQIKEVDQRIYLVLEKFVDIFVNSKRQPNVKAWQDGLNHIETVIKNTNKDIFLLINTIETDVLEKGVMLKQVEDKIDELKKKNRILMLKMPNVQASANSAEGLFEDEKELYRNNVLEVFLLVIGILIGCSGLFKIFSSN
jgi:hypothetical protein